MAAVNLVMYYRIDRVNPAHLWLDLSKYRLHRKAAHAPKTPKKKASKPQVKPIPKTGTELPAKASTSFITKQPTNKYNTRQSSGKLVSTTYAEPDSASENEAAKTPLLNISDDLDCPSGQGDQSADTEKCKCKDNRT